MHNVLVRFRRANSLRASFGLVKKGRKSKVQHNDYVESEYNGSRDISSSYMSSIHISQSYATGGSQPFEVQSNIGPSVGDPNIISCTQDGAEVDNISGRFRGVKRLRAVFSLGKRNRNSKLRHDDNIRSEYINSGDISSEYISQSYATEVSRPDEFVFNISPSAGDPDIVAYTEDGAIGDSLPAVPLTRALIWQLNTIFRCENRIYRYKTRMQEIEDHQPGLNNMIIEAYSQLDGLAEGEERDALVHDLEVAEALKTEMTEDMAELVRKQERTKLELDRPRAGLYQDLQEIMASRNLLENISGESDSGDVSWSERFGPKLSKPVMREIAETKFENTKAWIKNLDAVGEGVGQEPAFSTPASNRDQTSLHREKRYIENWMVGIDDYGDRPDDHKWHRASWDVEDVGPDDSASFAPLRKGRGES